MKIDTFEDDYFGLRDFAERLERLIRSEKHFVEGSLVVALNGNYGSGKSTFQRMWRVALENDNYHIVSLNAWESDYFGDPLFSITSALTSQLEGRADTGAIENVKSAARRLGRIAVGLGNQLVSRQIGIDAMGAINDAEAEDVTEHSGFDLCIARRAAMAHLKDMLANLFEVLNEPTIFFVDELDRCRPDYAISYLEVIKHIFDIEDTTFILAVDRDQLENSAKSAFGSGLNFNEYFRKFVHREVNLPRPSESGYARMVREYTANLMEMEGVRRSSLDANDGFYDRCTSLIMKSGLTPRQVQELFRMLSHVLESTREDGTKIRWPYTVVSLLMLVTDMSYENWYERISEEPLTIEEGVEFIYTFSDDLNSGWWLAFLMSAAAIKYDGNDLQSKLLEVAGSPDSAIYESFADPQPFRMAWGLHGVNQNKLFEAKQKLLKLEQWMA
ncbi:P-loop NTPase fold protein [Idiomarina sp. HB]|uniref:KAP family P-loop NTPase fold protein n=1 Tax=Idiomarina sp. HB TaxID=3110479 RepID=UPI003A80C853